MCRPTNRNSCVNTCWLILCCSQARRYIWREELRGSEVQYNYDDEAQIPPTICHVCTVLQAIKREREREQLCHNDDEAQIPPAICQVFICLTISITCCQLEGERARHAESVWETERMPEGVRVTHGSQTEWGRTHGGPTLSYRVKERKYARAELHEKESWQQREREGSSESETSQRTSTGISTISDPPSSSKKPLPPSAQPDSPSTGTSK